MDNPFVTKGYAGPEYFCDRVEETKRLVELTTNGNNIALISPRRVGKTDLIHHCFQQPELKEKYYTFHIVQIVLEEHRLWEPVFHHNFQSFSFVPLIFRWGLKYIFESFE